MFSLLYHRYSQFFLFNLPAYEGDVKSQKRCYVRKHFEEALIPLTVGEVEVVLILNSYSQVARLNVGAT